MFPGMELMGCQDLAVPAEVMQHVVRVESSFNPYAIGVVGGHLVRQPTTLAEALATVRMLEQRGYDFSLGLAQVNRSNLDKYGLDSYEKAFEACPNLQAGSRILAECYSRSGGSWPKSFSCYYSGDFETGFRHGYVRKIYASIRAAEPVRVDDPLSMGAIATGPSGATAPTTHVRSRVLDATRMASTWPVAASPAKAAPDPVTAQLSYRTPVRVSLVGSTEAAPAGDRPTGTADMAALPPTAAAAAMGHAQAGMDAAFVF